ncbi:MAG: 30S ribosomal protein S7 [Lentisphaerae bacterium]|jgi:small subunit ribosomal protein S7|nr:30S ribosomal protein S7 [Lentisphaerota bacterium]
MARKIRKVKRPALADPKYGSDLVANMINYMMRDGKKSIAEKIVYGAIEEVGQRFEGEDALEIVSQAVNNMKPRVEVKSRRVGGSTYQVPVEIKPNRQLALALRWLSTYASGRRGVSMPKAVALEIVDAYNNQGNIIKKRDDTHKMAQANKAFAHYAW